MYKTPVLPSGSLSIVGGEEGGGRRGDREKEKEGERGRGKGREGEVEEGEGGERSDRKKSSQAVVTQADQHRGLRQHLRRTLILAGVRVSEKSVQRGKPAGLNTQVSGGAGCILEIPIDQH